MKNILILILFTCQFAFSQTDSLSRKKINFGLSGSLGFAYRKLIQNKNKDGVNIPKVIELRNDFEVKDKYTSFGLTFNYYFKKWISIGVDLNYNNFNYKTKQEIFYPTIYDPTIPDKSQTFYQFGTIEMPIYVGYYYTIKKFNLFVNIGLGTHYLAKANSVYTNWYPNGDVKVKTIDKTYDTSFNHNLNNFYLSLNSKLGVDYSPLSYLSIRLSPELKYGITPINKDNINTKLFGYGLNLSLNLKI